MEGALRPVDPYIDELVNISLFEIVKDRSFVQVGQVGHVLGLLILRRVQLLQQVLLDCALLGIGGVIRWGGGHSGCLGQGSNQTV